MSRKSKRNMLLALAATLVLAGVIVVVVSTRSGGSRRDASPALAHSASRSAGASGEMAAAARYLGSTPAQLRRRLHSGATLAQIANATPNRSANGLLEALVAARAARLDAGAGKLSAAARERRLAAVRRRMEAQLHRLTGYVGLPVSAGYLGVSVEQLSSELQSGRSLAQIADATPGKSATGLIQARAKSNEAALAAAVKAGRLSKATGSALRASLRARITREVDRVPHA